MRHARLRLAVRSSAAGHDDRVPPFDANGGNRRTQLSPVDLRPSPRVMQPERQLMAAVLVDAVATWRRYRQAQDGRARKRLAEVFAWLEDPSTRWQFAFARICAELELDAERIRVMLCRDGRRV